MRQPKLDHVIFHTRDIAATEAAFSAAGFAVQRRDDAGQSHGTENRFIVFDDGAYLLLMAFTDPAKAAAHRLSAFLSTDTGFVDYGIGVTDSLAAEAQARSMGLEPSRPGEMRSKLASGAEWGVRLFTIGRGAPKGDDALPFVVQDLGSRENRVPAFVAHPNGAHSILALHVEAHDPSSVTRCLDGLGDGADGDMGRLPLKLSDRTGRARAKGQGGVLSLDIAGESPNPVDLTVDGASIAIVPVR